MKIVVLAGGISTERDVSLCSGRNIYEALKMKTATMWFWWTYFWACRKKKNH